MPHIAATAFPHSTGYGRPCSTTAAATTTNNDNNKCPTATTIATKGG
jgi:hypothetical protein